MINGEIILRKVYDNLDEKQYQPAGIDLTLDSLQELVDGNLHLHGLFEGIKILPEQKKINTTTIQIKGSLRKVYTLEPHIPYIATTKEKINIGDSSAQFYLPRSSLLRAGVDVRTALGDPGFNGHLSFLVINHRDTPFMIEKGVRFAQLVDMQCINVENLYDGDYNEE